MKTCVAWIRGGTKTLTVLHTTLLAKLLSLFTWSLCWYDILYFILGDNVLVSSSFFFCFLYKCNANLDKNTPIYATAFLSETYYIRNVVVCAILVSSVIWFTSQISVVSVRVGNNKCITLITFLAHVHDTRNPQARTHTSITQKRYDNRRITRVGMWSKIIKV